MEGKKKILLIIASIGTLLLVVPIIGLILFQAIGEHSYTNTTESVPSFYSNEKSLAPNGSNGKGTSRELNDSPSDQTKIIKTGNINKRVDNFSESEEKIRKISSENNGEVIYFVDEGEGNKRVLNIEIKVPVANFEKVFSALKEISGENIFSSIDMRDVTTEVMDLESRLKTFRSTEAQLLEILQKATSVTDTISVYKELNEIRANIESIEGQLKYYSTKTDYSTVRITLKQSSVGATLEDTPWKPLGVLKDAGRAYISFLKVLGTVLIYFIVFTAPVWVIYGIYRVVKKNSGR